jgi:hypothetical protein
MATGKTALFNIIKTDHETGISNMADIIDFP